MTDDQQMLDVLKSVADYLYKGGIGDGACAVDEIVKRYERMKAEWIDPQRIVDLAERYQKDGRQWTISVDYTAGVVRHLDDKEPWFIDYGPGDNDHSEGATLGDALKAAEA